MIAHTKRCRRNGFTLLELLIAIAIFAVLASIAYPGLTRILAHRAALESVRAEMSELQFGLAVIENDIMSAAARPVRDEFGDPVAAMRGGLDAGLLELSRRQTEVPGMETLPALSRIEFRIDENALIRRQWRVLDRMQASTFEERVLLHDVRAIGVEFFERGQWLPYWPPQSSNHQLMNMPAALRLRLDWHNAGTLTRIFVLREIGTTG